MSVIGEVRLTSDSGGTELPENFDKIRLSKKEIDRVKAIFPDFEQDPL
jgi:hypothetical protein